ncbi:MAG: hypothetical protein U9P14_11880, partial [Gemmatimonadota bacterium]|nr:hypothetical protein [Gemmatimonadota bacterium]
FGGNKGGGLFSNLLGGLFGGNKGGGLFGNLLGGIFGGGQGGGIFDNLAGGLPEANCGLFNGSGLCDRIGKTRDCYGGMIGDILDGNETATGSIRDMLDVLMNEGDQSCVFFSESYKKMGRSMFDVMGNYSNMLGSLMALAAKAFAALKSMNPWAAAAAAAALAAFQRKMGKLANSVGAGSVPSAAAAGAGAPASEQAAGPQTAIKVVIIDSNGPRSGSTQDVDRVLARADVDRRLRAQIQELTRTGSLSLIN